MMKTALYIFSVIFFVEMLVNIHAYREFDVNGDRTILSLENETVQIQCRTDMAMAYCGFMDPNGKRYSISGALLINGHCAIKINVTKQDSGEWKCHVGKNLVGVESEQTIMVRVVNKLAAVVANVTVGTGDSATLFCASAQRLTPLSYCRFEPPSGPPFSISPEVNKKNSILGKYYFPLNKSLERGDCAVTIRRVSRGDVGAWGCSAGLNDGNEYVDFVYLQVHGSSKGIVLGVVVGVIAVAMLGAGAWWRRDCLTGGRTDRRDLGLQGGALELQGGRTPSCVIPVLVVESPTTSADATDSAPSDP